MSIKQHRENKELLEWQRSLDPMRFNKATGAQYHTAPAVIFPDSADYPDDAPVGSVTILFHIDEESWIGEPERLDIDEPLIVEKPPATKRAKNGPIIVMGSERAYTAIPVKENYYWSANVLSKHHTTHITFKPGKKRTDGKHRKIVVIATFIPNDGEPVPN